MIAALACALIVAASDSPVAAARDEVLRLDAAERRIDAGPYTASLQVGVDRPVTVRVGVSLEATRITAILRGVRGTVRFHGDLSRLEHRASPSLRRALSAEESQ